MQLNHLNLAVANTTATADFFQQNFGFVRIADRGNGNLIILQDETGFLLTLMADKTVTESTYPKSFHVGFLVASRDKVHAAHARLTTNGIATQLPAEMRGGEAFGFYCHAPGGLLIEISAP